MHEMLTIVTDDRGVFPWVCQSVGRLSVTRLNSAARTVCAGSFSTGFAKLVWSFVIILYA